ncbi:hypothetical protein [Bacillus tropicus]|uniref:hypothetical protein n=1 Tax=Bacillus tropicus TaxID=2026188 RepID=UPI000BEB5776|nr:hypothetical protein [Bacillus tropicus]PDY92617.1 hypothetical protein CON09_10235 [Bacillus anthracis]
MKKQFLLRLPEELYNGIADKTAKESISMQNYIQNLIAKDLKINMTVPVPLIEKVEHACITKQLQEPFTTSSLQKWIQQNNIVNSQNGQPYSKSSIQSLLGNSSLTSNNKNLNRKVLHRKKNAQGVYEYWF